MSSKFIGDDDNSYVDTKNAIMLAVLGLYETVELMTLRGNNKTKYQVRVIDNEQCFCFDEFTWPLFFLLSTPPAAYRPTRSHVMDILAWHDGVLDYVNNDNNE